ncbi:hypothetical protein [Natronoglomus mannanivorans]|uniref:Uncharacterized protein n=1 Tax=Natronoglomus mannanivorans TaxID=2979990 RepID=A0AAP2YWQ9_9EURY|nr:hypothetical protein [Halobacteria archaeon AArc-xg1-1]
MGRRLSSDRTGRWQRTLSRQLADLEAELEENKRRVTQLENTLKAVTRQTNDISIGGPCSCGESFLIVRQRVIYCPQCGYRRTM